MDPFTHGLVGAAAAGATATSRHRAAACSGFVAALLADLDVLLSRADDPLYQLEFHRQFSHSLLFVPVGALLATMLLWWPMRNKISRKGLYLACFSGYATAGLLDACTSYGTQLLWPFSEARIAWNLTPVVEPVITFGLMVLVGLFIVRKRTLWAWLALGWLGVLLAHGAYRSGPLGEPRSRRGEPVCGEAYPGQPTALEGYLSARRPRLQRCRENRTLETDRRAGG